jgi:hypothetical protein
MQQAVLVRAGRALPVQQAVHTRQLPYCTTFHIRDAGCQVFVYSRSVSYTWSLHR